MPRSLSRPLALAALALAVAACTSPTAPAGPAGPAVHLDCGGHSNGSGTCK